MAQILLQADSPVSSGIPNQEQPVDDGHFETSSSSTFSSEAQEYLNIANSNPHEEPCEPDPQSEPFLASLESVSEVDPSLTQPSETEPGQIEHPSTPESVTSENQQSMLSSHVREIESQIWKRHHSIDHGELQRRGSNDFGSGQEVTPRSPSINQRRTSVDSDKEGNFITSPEISMQRVSEMIKKLILALVKRPSIFFLEDAHVSLLGAPF